MSGRTARACSVRELTARARGGVAVLEVVGEGALEALRELCPELRPGAGPHLVRLGDAGDELDEALVLVHSEREVELHLHGSPPLIERVRDLFGGEAEREAARSVEERAGERLARAPSEAGARILLDQSEGALRRELEALLAFDWAQARPRVERLLALGRCARAALVPARVVLAGPVNAGKSTLFNALCGARRAIVSADAGTTRDVLAERIQLGPWPVDLIDAPGERCAPAGAAGGAGEQALALEARGLDLARARAERADLVLWLAPAPGPVLALPQSADPERWRLVLSRADLLEAGALAALDPDLARLSARGEPRAAARTVERLLTERLGLPERPWLAGRAVPFEDPQLATLAAALDEANESRARALLAGLLEPAAGWEHETLVDAGPGRG